MICTDPSRPITLLESIGHRIDVAIEHGRQLGRVVLEITLEGARQ